MRLAYIGLLAAWVAWASPATAQTYIGPNMQCSAFLAKHTTNDLVLGYIQGYLSGSAFWIYVTQNQRDLLRNAVPREVVSAVMGYCLENPEKTLLNSMNEITLLLNRRAKSGG